jgi:hypothetical protein
MSIMNDKIKILCSRCHTPIRAKARSLLEGYQMQCPGCDRMITFSVDSSDANVRRAMTAARRARNGWVMPEASADERGQ